MSETNYDLLKNILAELKNDFEKSFRCVYRTPLPTAQTQAKHINILVDIHNSICDNINTKFQLLDERQQKEIETFFITLKNRFNDLLKRVEISDRAPRDLNTHFKLKIIEEEDTQDTLDNKSIELENIPTRHSKEKSNIELHSNNNKQANMATSLESFMNLATKLLPDFDSSPEHLPKFIYALDILEQMKGDHETIAVMLIKSKISGKAQKSITDLNTIKAIKERLQHIIKGESSMAVSTKLLGITQLNKSGNDFMKEIESLANKLEESYISEGMPNKLAEEFATQNAVRAITKGARSEKVKNIMMAATFHNISEVTTKFIAVNTEIEEARVNYMQNRNSRRSYYRNQNNRNNYNRYNNQNNNRKNNNNRNYNQQYENRNYQPNKNQNKKQFNRENNRTGNRNVRYVDNESGNEMGPQHAQLGNQD